MGRKKNAELRAFINGTSDTYRPKGTTALGWSPAMDTASMCHLPDKREQRRKARQAAKRDLQRGDY